VKKFIFTIVLLLPIGCFASDEFGKYRVTYPPDHVTCDSFLLAVNECNHGHCVDLKTFSDWLMGFITAYNLSTPDTFDIVAKTDMKSSITWLTNYCKQNSSKEYADAVHGLMIDLYPTRQKVRPKNWVEKK